MNCLTPQIKYQLEGDQTLVLLSRDESTGQTVRGTTNEEVIEMLLDRLREQNKRVPCRENSIALTKLEEALMWLDKRTRKRNTFPPA